MRWRRRGGGDQQEEEQSASSGLKSKEAVSRNDNLVQANDDDGPHQTAINSESPSRNGFVFLAGRL